MNVVLAEYFKSLGCGKKLHISAWSTEVGESSPTVEVLFEKEETYLVQTLEPSPIKLGEDKIWEVALTQELLKKMVSPIRQYAELPVSIIVDALKESFCKVAEELSLQSGGKKEESSLEYQVFEKSSPLGWDGENIHIAVWRPAGSLSTTSLISLSQGDTHLGDIQIEDVFRGDYWEWRLNPEFPHMEGIISTISSVTKVSKGVKQRLEYLFQHAVSYLNKSIEYTSSPPSPKGKIIASFYSLD
jgi:hypothetical protein